jgi:hypothetical protein
MEGITKAILLLIAIGMIIFFLGSKVLETETANITQVQMETIDTNISSLDSQTDNIENKYNEIDLMIEQLEAEKENIANERFVLNNELIALETQREAFEKEKNIYNLKMDDLDERQAQLEQYGLSLQKKEALLELEQQRLTSEMSLLQAEFDELKRIENIYFPVTGGLVFCSILLNAIAFIYYKKGTTNISSNVISRILLKIPSYRRYLIHQARQREIQYNINGLNNNQKGGCSFEKLIPDDSLIFSDDTYSYSVN